MRTDLNEMHDIGSAISDQDRYQTYKAVSVLAVASLGLGLLSVLAFFNWIFGAIPLVGILMGVVAIRQIKIRRHELTGLPIASIGVILSMTLLAAGWGWLTYDYYTEVREGYLRITYDDLRPPEDNPGEFPPARAKALDGQKVFIKGYMFPSDRTVGLKEFTLCRDNKDCCFGGQPKAYDMIRVKMKDGDRARFSKWQRKVDGVFRIKYEERKVPGGVQIQTVYELEVDLLR